MADFLDMLLFVKLDRQNIMANLWAERWQFLNDPMFIFLTEKRLHRIIKYQRYRLSVGRTLYLLSIKWRIWKQCNWDPIKQFCHFSKLRIFTQVSDGICCGSPDEGGSETPSKFGQIYLQEYQLTIHLIIFSMKLCPNFLIISLYFAQMQLWKLPRLKHLCNKICLSKTIYTCVSPFFQLEALNFQLLTFRFINKRFLVLFWIFLFRCKNEHIGNFPENLTNLIRRTIKLKK